MKYFIYIPGMPLNGDTIRAGKSLGGSESAGYYVATELRARGHEVACFSNTDKEQNIDGVVWLPIGPRSKEHPFGMNFQMHATQVPHDVLLAQRAPGVFAQNYNSKLNYFWTHDLALKRFIPLINGMLWNVDRFFAVSDWHKAQVKQVYAIDNNFISVLPNAIDPRLFQPASVEEKVKHRTMIYSSRPERGLENLVKPDGVMEQLKDQNVRLLVCGYDNTTADMRDYYQYLYGRCEQLENVKMIGHLSKQQLADTMSKCWLHVYPTEFEETSCITAMESQVSGNPFLTTEVGALPETLKDGGVYFAKMDEMASKIIYLLNNPGKWNTLHNLALKKAESYTWSKSVDMLESEVEKDFAKITSDKKGLFDHLRHNSDFAAAAKLGVKENYPIAAWENCSDVSLVGTTKFYDDIAKYNIDKGDTHMLGDDNILCLHRLIPVLAHLNTLPPGSKVLDYGCCVGQMTSAFAKEFRDLEFVGVDISSQQIKIANEHVEKNQITNVTYVTAAEPLDKFKDEFDAVLCLDTLEHIYDYHPFIVKLEACVKQGGRVMFSTPSGPIEAQRNDENHPVEHMHHFEPGDIDDIIKNKKGKDIKYISGARTKTGLAIGSHVWGWVRDSDADPVGHIDYERKMKCQKPRQTVSCCMITRATSGTIRETVESVAPFVDEFVIGVDGDVDKVSCSLDKIANVKLIPIQSPLDTGFDAARNSTIGRASREWILWIDDDEIWRGQDTLVPFLRNNQFNAYAVAQHHFSADPAGLLKTDFPYRLFRNHKAVKFHGVVHEHPETELNEGVGHSFMLPAKQSCICHNGYDTEEIRRERFHRNFPLMVRDREKYPGRLLGRHLWLRDLAHMNRFDWEQGHQFTDVMRKRAQEIIDIWRAFITENVDLRLVFESIPYMSEAAELLTNRNTYKFSFNLAVSKDMPELEKQKALVGAVTRKQDITDLLSLVVRQQSEPIERNEKYA